MDRKHHERPAELTPLATAVAPFPGLPVTAAPPRTSWQPGDPLYERATCHSGASYRHYLFNFRYESDGEQCACGDAASWPEPRNGQNLGNRDELGEFIDDVLQDDVDAEWELADPGDL